jgi:hypothetical protein
MAEPTSCCAVPGGYCARVDALFNLPGIHVIDVGWRAESGDEDAREQLLLAVETGPRPMGCPACGVVAASHGRRVRRLHDISAFGAPVELVWRVRRWRCGESACPVGVFTEESDLALARAKLTTRGGVVGDQLHPTRHGLGRCGGSSARGGLAHRVGGDRAAARGPG